VRSDALSKDAVLEVLQGLIRTPSVNPTLAPGEPGGEAAIAAYACGWLSARGVRAWQEEVAPGRPNAVAEVGDGNGPTLVLCAHLDTVATTGMTIPPFDPRVEGNRVYGRGSYDMKGGAAACMAAAAALADEPLGGKVMLALVCDEEYASIGASDFVRRHPADACILTEPSSGPLELVLAHKGFVWLEVTTRGKAAHGSRWDLGVSAIGCMGRIIAALEEYDKRELRARVHPLVGPASMHCALVSGGTGLSTYAETCTLGVERRTIPGETPEQAVRDIERVIRAAGETAEVRLTLERRPLECDPSSAIANAVRDAATSIAGRTPAEVGVAYWMDAAIFASAGIPTVDYGAGGAGAHEAVEWVDLGSVVMCARVLVEAAQTFCGGTGRSH
jgi:acetylornithine deacetylase